MKNSIETVTTEATAFKNEVAINAALEAASELMAEETSLVSYRSRNYILILGSDKRVHHAVKQLVEKMIVSVLIDSTGENFDITALPENVNAGYGNLFSLSGHLGEFVAEISIKDEVVNLAQVHDAQKNSFDIVLDLTDKPLFTQSLLPFGYFSPKNEQELEDVLHSIPDMVGEFEKPKFFDYNASICAHGNSGLKACQRCIDVCPADAIMSIKDAIKVDPYLCQGGGACATVCPTGAIQYVYPRLKDTLEKLRHMLKAYYGAGGQHATIVFYGENESALIEQKKFVGYIPFQLEETASAGMDVWLSAFAYGAHEVILLTHDDTDKEVIAAIDTQLTYAHAILAGMGYDKSCLHRYSRHAENKKAKNIQKESFSVVNAGVFIALNDKRSALRLAIDHLFLFAPSPQDNVNLPAGAPFGEVQVNKETCTLCMACVSVCPASALADGDELPQLRFSEANCVQCGLCSKACPEDALTLVPRYNYAADLRRNQRILNEDEPFCCLLCGKPFATHSVIKNITKKLSNHYMFQSEEAVYRLKLCGDCRVKDMYSKEMAIKH